MWGWGVSRHVQVEKVRGGYRGGLRVKSRTAASVFNLQTGARKKEEKRHPALAVRFKDRLLQTLLPLCAQKKGAGNTEEFTVG